MHIFHPDGPGKVVCTCGREFGSEQLMHKHQASSGSHRLLVCPVCGALYKTRQSLDSHMLLHKESKNYVSDGSWPFTCPLCNERLSSQASLSNHIASTHSDQDFKCHLCDKTCKTKQLLSQHFLRKHKIGKTEYPCPVCNKVFLISKDLRRHVQSHNPEGSHECSVCQAKFKSHPTLQSHMKTHSKGKPYDCVICLVPFTTIEALKDHLDSHHGIEINDEEFAQNWNRKCPVCAQIFLRRTGLAVHIKTHFDYEDTEILFVEPDEEEDSRDCIETMTILTNERNREESGDKSQGETNLSYEFAVSTSIKKAEDELRNETEEKTVIEVKNGGNGKEMSANPAIRTAKTRCIKVTCDKESTKDEIERSITKEGLYVPERDIIEYCEAEPEQIVSGSDTQTGNDTKKSQMIGDVTPSGSKGISNEEEETKFICGQCTSVFIDMDDLQTHLLTCYQQDTDDEYVVVFEVDESNASKE